MDNFLLSQTLFLTLAFAAGTPFCPQSSLDEAAISDAIIDQLNAHRAEVNNGDRSNGGGDMLPAGQGLPQVKWSCDLEVDAVNMLANQCPADYPRGSNANCAAYTVGGDNGEGLANHFNSLLTSLDFYELTDYSGDVKYSGEDHLEGYVSLISQNTTEIGCAYAQCRESSLFAILCLVDQPCLEIGHVIYKRDVNTTSDSSDSTSEPTVVYTSISSDTDTTSTSTETTVTESTTTSTTTTITTPIISETADTTAATAVTQVQGTTEGSTDVTSTTTTLTTTTTTTATMESESALPGTVTAEQDNTICPDNEGMTDSLRIALWAKHNTLRSSLALGAVNNGKTNNTCRKASKMPQLIYCCELEKKAMERASQCDQMDSTPQGNVSENNWNFTEKIDRELTDAGKAAAQRWWSEITKLESGIDQIQNLYYTHFGINSFAKMASELTTGVGCAVVRCENRINVVCHYDTTLGNGMKLYTVGPTCNKCENGTSSCVNGLCPAASATCSIATTTATPEATTTSAEPNTQCPENHGMTDPLRLAFLTKHNTLRTTLALGATENGKTGVMCRKASKMPTLTYDCKLETSAIARASQCSQMNSTPSQNISENSHIFTANLNRTLSQAAQAATQLWWSELAALESGIDQIQNIFYTHLGINSFAKIASDLTTKIGCAVIHCTDSINVVCHYQTTLANAKKLYTAGPTCNRCENGTVSCVNGLCPASSK